MKLPLTALALVSLVAEVYEMPVADADPRPRSSGIYAEAGVGGRGYLADAAEHSALGPSMSIHLGTDLFSWFSVGGRLEASNHAATVPAPPEGEYYQLYGASAEGRLGFAAGPMAFFVDGAAGFAMISTNVLEKVAILDPGERFTPKFSAGGGLEYQLQNRHHAFGIAGEYTLLPAFDASAAVGGRFFFRYTY